MAPVSPTNLEEQEFIRDEGGDVNATEAPSTAADADLKGTATNEPGNRFDLVRRLHVAAAAPLLLGT